MQGKNTPLLSEKITLKFRPVLSICIAYNRGNKIAFSSVLRWEQNTKIFELANSFRREFKAKYWKTIFNLNLMLSILK